VYNASQGDSFSWGEGTFRLYASLPNNFSYKATTNSIPADVPRDAAKLIQVTIGNIVTIINGSQFQDCTALTSVTFAPTSTVTTIRGGAFYRCAFTSIIIPDSVTSIGEIVFHSCSALTSIAVGTNNANYSSLDGVVFNKLQTTLVIFPPGKGVSYAIPHSVTSIGRYAFYSSALTSVTFAPNSNVKDIDDVAFAGCSSLTSITIPSSVTRIGYNAFDQSGLTTVTIANGQLANEQSGISGISSPINNPPGVAFFGRQVATLLPTPTETPTETTPTPTETTPNPN
jgi:hypothetical protein